MTEPTPAFSSGDLGDLLELMHRVLARLDEYALSLPASYVQLAIDHVQTAAAA